MKTRVDLDNVKSTIFIAALLTLFVANAQSPWPKAIPDGSRNGT
jgi:hypothetical protein